MVFKCCVSFCSNTNKDTMMHRFPYSDKEVYDIWLDRIGNEKLKEMHPEQVYKNFRVCHNHFSDYCNIIGCNKRMLKARSLPTTGLPDFHETPTAENSFLIWNKGVTDPQSGPLERIDSGNSFRTPSTTSQDNLMENDYNEKNDEQNLKEINNARQELGGQFRTETLQTFRQGVGGVGANDLIKKQKLTVRPANKYWMERHKDAVSLQVADAMENSLEESNSITDPEVAQNPNKQTTQFVNAGGLTCRICLGVITTQRYYFLKIMGHLTKTIKEMIIFCVPQMATTLSDDDIICYECLHAVEFCVKFIESCLEVEEKLRNLDDEEIDIKYGDLENDNDDHDDLPADFQSVILDHDYVIKLEPDEMEDSEILEVQTSPLTNDQPPKSNSHEIDTSTQPDQKTIRSPNDILKSRMFKENTQLQEILQTVIRESFKCGYCSKMCRTENCLLDHMRRMHKTIQKPTEETLDQSPGNPNGKTILNKSNCNKRSQKKSERDEKYLTDPVIKCPFCVEKLGLCQMEAHLRRHNQGQTEFVQPKRKTMKTRKKRMLKCTTCLERFTSKDDFKDHLQVHPPYMCEHCGKVFIQHSSLASHKTTHNDPNTYICEFCGKGYRERNMLNVHLKLHENKKFECDKCPKVFNTQLHLKNHIHRVHTSNEVGQCSQCGTIFKNRSSLKSHVRLVHLKLKPFKCEICKRQFGRADYLRLHIKTHTREPSDGTKLVRTGRKTRWKLMFPDSSTSSELLPCKFCGIRFQGVAKLKMHLETHVRRFPCQYCPLTFARKQYCKRHELLHNGLENFFRCNICWKRMKSEEELEEHIETKHNKLKYTCHICGEMFHKTFLLNQHSLREHSNTVNAENAKQIIFESLLEATATGNNEV